MKLFKSGVATMSALAFLTSSPLALALDGQDFGEKFIAVVSSSDLDITFESVSVSGDTVTLSNFGLTSSDNEEVTISADLVFTGVEEAGDGGYRAEQATIDDFSFTDEEFAVSIASIVVRDLKIPAKAVDFLSDEVASKEDILASLNYYRSLFVGSISISFKGQEVASIASLEAAESANNELTDYTFDYNVTGIRSNLAQIIPEPEAQGMLALFGLETIDAELRAKGIWNFETGHIKLIESAITIENVGRLNMLFDILDFDLDFMVKIAHSQAVFEANGETSDTEFDAADEEMMALLAEKLSVSSFSVDFQDDGITSKILDFFASQQGAPKEVLAAGFAAAVPAMAAEVGLSEDFQLQLLKAVTAFLTDPKSLAITASPSAPVKLSAIAEVSEDPGAIMSLLNVSVTANE